MAHRLAYRVLRTTAIGLGTGLTAYSAWLSWSHFGDPTGPIAAVTGAGLFVFGECAWHGRQRLRAVLLFGLGALALVISGTAVLHRVSATQEARLQSAKSDNLPRAEAVKALDDAKVALASAEADARRECGSGRGSLYGAGAAGRGRPETGGRHPRQAGWSWCTHRRRSGSRAHCGLPPDHCGAIPAGRAGPPADLAGANGAAPPVDRAGTHAPQRESEAQEAEDKEEAGPSQASPEAERRGAPLRAQGKLNLKPWSLLSRGRGLLPRTFRVHRSTSSVTEMVM
jgi:hypothetical protein